MFLVKLGGSIITDKAKENTYRTDTTTRLATELTHANDPLILVHGAGSFGHILAKKHHLNDGLTTPTQTLGFAHTQANVQHLNTLILQTLQDQGLPAVSLPPHALTILDNHHPKTMDYTTFHTYLNEGFLPVTYGDVALDTTLHGSICSGDLLMQLLAHEFHPTTVIFALDEDGLYTANPKTHPDATFIDTITTTELSHLSTSLDTRTDVTKGMQGKLDTITHIATQNTTVILVNGNKPNRLQDILQGKKTRCTIIRGS